MANQNIEQPLRVRIHLNLARPELSESSVKVKSPKTGAWLTIAYASEMKLANVIPVVHQAAQKRVVEKGGRKSPHAFLEGDLISFSGRLRDKMPESLKKLATDILRFEKRAACLSSEFNGVAINYNPRFASCFYRDQPTKEQVKERFVGADVLIVRGWAFHVTGGRFTGLSKSDTVQNYQQVLTRTSGFEKQAFRKARKFKV